MDETTPPAQFVHSAESTTIRVGSQTFTKPADSPFKETCNQVAREMGLGRFTIVVETEDGRKMLGKSLPANFVGLQEVELIKYDAGG